MLISNSLLFPGEADDEYSGFTASLIAPVKLSLFDTFFFEFDM